MFGRDLQLGKNIFPNFLGETETDLKHCIGTEEALREWIEEYNLANEEVVIDNEFRTVRVPMFKGAIVGYCIAKAEDCRIWGCE